MRRLRLTIEYDGTDYSGWQRQDNAPSVQQTIEEKLAEMTRVATPIRGAGRTDAGVHAIGQVAHFDTEANIPTLGFLRGLNSLLPRSIAIHDCSEVAPDFDARFSARGKLYRYQVWNDRNRSALRDRFVWHLPAELRTGPMRQAAQLLQGRQDFAAFRASDCERRTTVRVIRRLEVVREGNLLHIDVEATAFLKNMVRILAGTLIEVGRGQRSLDQVREALRTGERTFAGQTAPARGLTLMRVDY